MHVKDYKDKDYNDLIELWEKAGLPYKPNGRDRRDKIAQSLKNSSLRLILAYDNSNLIASVLVTHDGRKGWINRLAVHPDYWHRKIASTLIAYAEKILREEKIEIFACLVENYNNASLQLFQKNGYIKHEEIIYLTKREYPDV
ncbi:MAG: GNAT family N-acetyltransferase [Candidatus Cloacimonadota bacterium]|nr:GNAT family N-acetyltransferase [Candidatus Cloacimonadota bacterium]